MMLVCVWEAGEGDGGVYCTRSPNCTHHMARVVVYYCRLLLSTGCLARGVSSVGKDSYFNYLLRAGSYDCFLEELQEGSNVEVEYHVSGLCHCVW